MKHRSKFLPILRSRNARGGLPNPPFSAGFGNPAGANRDLLILLGPLVLTAVITALGLLALPAGTALGVDNQAMVVAQSIADLGNCGDPATAIHAIQGSGAASPEAGSVHVIEGVIVGDFQDTSIELGGFFIQEEDTDADSDPTTSEGVFVHDNGFGVDVSEGDVVRVQGQVVESGGLTEIGSVSDVAVCPGSAGATPALVSLPVTDTANWEYYEGMLVTISQTLYATGNYNQGRYGEVELSARGRLDSPTHLVTPGAPALKWQDLNDRSRIQLDDGSAVQSPQPLPPYLGSEDTLRAGDSIPGLTGVLGYGSGDYEIHPTEAVTFTRFNNRDAVPRDVGGTLTVASFNLMNYFSTIDTGAQICGPSGTLECRGADSSQEFTRQRDKIISALSTMDADIVGLMEVENNATEAVQNLVDGLNDAMGAGTYAFIDTGTIGSDAIKVAFIYKPATVTPVGSFAILDASVDSRYMDTKLRPALAQTFEQVATGETVTVVVNDFASRESTCDDVGDPDQGDGQGNCNGVRTAAAQALVDWLATEPTGSGDPDLLIIGDLSAYTFEDPIAVIRDAGYTNLIAVYVGTSAYSYVSDGQAGYLEHALASASLKPQVTGATEWHINADEPLALDYNDFNPPALYKADPYRSSDHDLIVVGLDLGVQTRPRVYLPAVVQNYAPSSTPSPNPFPQQSYRMEYAIRIGDVGKLWMPVPRTADGMVVDLIDIVPTPDDVFEDSQGNLIAFWDVGYRSTTVYSITFNADLEPIIRYDINPDLIGAYDTSSWEYQRYTRPSQLIQSDAGAIIQLAHQIVGEETNPYHQARLIHSWVDSNIKGGAITGSDCYVASALAALERGTAGCDGFNNLFVALLRARGIPARIVGGLVTGYQGHFADGEDEPGTHWWSEFYLPGYGWIQSDATQNAFFAKIYEPRVALFRGEDIELGHSHPLGTVAGFHIPHADLIPDGACGTQTYGESLMLVVARLDSPPTPMLPISIDGEGADWQSYTPAITDPQGDTTGGPHTDMKAVFAELGPNYAYLMVEAYDPPLHSEAIIAFGFDLVYGDGSVRWLGGNISSEESLVAWMDDDGDGIMEQIPLTEVQVAWGNVMELRLPLWQLGDPAQVRNIFVNFFCEGTGGDKIGDY